jgi:3-deoxy-D-manno-octulosonic-acid transferase
LRHRGVPVYSVSSIFRPGQVFFRWYGKQYSRVLKCFTHFFVQNETSKRLLADIGLTNVSITGDTRFDRVLQIKEQSKQLPIVEQFVSSVKKETADMPANVFVAGSSWPPDEEIFIRYFNEHKNWKLIIAPHVIDEDHLRQIEKQLEGKKVVRYTDAEKGADVASADVLIINCFGLLSSIYHYGSVTYVGGGFGVSIHNVLEAAVWYKPVIIGPNNKKFQEAQELLSVGGCLEINNYTDFAQFMQRFEKEPAFLLESSKKAGDYVKSKSGATKEILSSVKL